MYLLSQIYHILQKFPFHKNIQYFEINTVITDAGKNHQQILKPLDESCIKIG